MEAQGFQLIQGDLFSTEEHFSLAHCVSRDLRMGKGIAVEFRKRFKNVSELKGQNPTIGSVVYLRMPTRFVFYLVTKERYCDKPTYESLTQALQSMKSICESNNIHCISLPKIGCGLDGLSWENVSPILQQLFPSPPYQVKVYTL